MTRNEVSFGRLKSVFLCLALVCMGSPALSLYAQRTAGAILGTVTDQSGAVIPNAKVTLTNEATAFRLSTVTSSNGTYEFTPIKIGTYRVSAESAGFTTVTHVAITVHVQEQVVVNFSLQPGRLTQTVQVTGAVSQLQTQNPSVGQVIGGRQVNDLPLNGRNFTFLAQLTAGVTTMQ